MPARWRRWAFHAGVAVLNTVIVRHVVYVPFLLWLLQRSKRSAA